MLKRISVKQITLGMYLKEFCGSWMEHPFWQNSFVLRDPSDIERILASRIQEVWIDTSKGLDVPDPNAAAIVPEPELEAEPPQSPQPQAVTPARIVTPASMSEELDRAALICSRSQQAVADMFAEARMGKAIDTVGAKQMVEEISDSINRNAGALISLARIKTADTYTYMHSVAVCALMIALGRQLALEEDLTRSLGYAGLLHDLGKATVPTEILNKPGKLTDAEFDVMRGHPKMGYDLLLATPDISPIALDVCLHHHEKVDGTGYPDRLRDAEISLHAKMGAVCDVYDAITSNRPYKAGWDPAESLKRMAEWSKGHFDQKVFHAFVKSLGIYPVGSLVRLSSGRIGVVVEQAGGSLLTPKVKVFYSTQKEVRIKPELLDLSRASSTEKIVAREDPDHWRFPDLDELWAGYRL